MFLSDVFVLSGKTNKAKPIPLHRKPIQTRDDLMEENSRVQTNRNSGKCSSQEYSSRLRKKCINFVFVHKQLLHTELSLGFGLGITSSTFNANTTKLFIV